MKKKLLANTFTAIIYQVIVFACGFMLPQLILQAYGSEVNGLITSITQFIAVITYLDLGVGAVVQSNLYRPLAQGDINLVSCIMASSNRFFRKIAIILVLYIGVLLVFYPCISEHMFDTTYVCMLILILGMDSFAKYYFGITNQLLLTADQKGYLTYIIQGITLIINLISSVILITCGMGIHAVKLSTAIIYLARPIVYYFYVKKNYAIKSEITYQDEPIKQKWNGFAQHIATVVLDGTDVIVLTLFSTLANVSIYSVYCLVVVGIKQLFYSLTTGIRPFMGNIWANGDLKKVNHIFALVEWLFHSVSIIVYGCTLVLIGDFVKVYTNHITDLDYAAPVFAGFFVIAYTFNAVRMPYNMLILASGHFKQTQHIHIIVAIINIVTSVVLVNLYGLVGVAVGTLVALSIQSVWQAIYVSRALIQRPVIVFVKQFLVDGSIVILAVIATKSFVLSSISYLAWVILGIQAFLVSLVISLAINAIFYRDKIEFLVGMGKRKLSSVIRK